MPQVRKLTLLRETEKAIQVRQEQARGTSTTAWIPVSQIDHRITYGTNPDGTKDITITIPTWLCEAKELDYD